MSDSLRPNIVLTGPSGGGKSTIGRRISTLTGRTFVDLGAEVVASIGDPREVSAEALTQLEQQLVKDLAPKRNQVIATTPTTLLDSENLVSLLGAEVYHLTASTDELAARVTADGLAMRPELADAEDLNATIDSLRDERQEVYDKFTSIDTTGDTVEQTIDKLRAAGADIADPLAIGAPGAAGRTDAQTRVFYFAIAICLAIALVLFILVLTF